MVIAALLSFAILLIAWALAPERSEPGTEAAELQPRSRVALNAPIYEVQAALDR
jgi:hypothetical protein